MDTNTLYYGDNLDVLREHIPDESVDLVYLDPPFKSMQDYNVLFEEKDGTDSAAQIKAFEDTWHWDMAAVEAYTETVEAGGDVSRALQAFRGFLGTNDMMAYLAMMAPRLVELRRVLKPTGSIYLHCDPTASHYLKMLMDAVFGGENFRNEITWKRKTGRGVTSHRSNRFGVCTDILLFYGKSKKGILHSQFTFDDPSYQKYVKDKFRFTDEHGRVYRIDNLASPSPRPNLIYEYKGYKPPKNGWAISLEKMKEWDRLGMLHFPKKKTGRIQRKRYLDELKGKPVQNLWDDIQPIGAHAAERLSYPTQKPEKLLDRIIKASSNEGDVVLDPFCGCGTTIAVAERMGRRWMGIDITHLAIGLIKHRLLTAFGTEAMYEVVGEPVAVSGARQLAEDDRHEFEHWALGLVGARRHDRKKKGADKGVDGRLYFHDEGLNGKTKQIVISVKSGHVQVSHIRDLRGVIEREEAEIGVLITLNDPTKPMRTEAADAGFYKSPGISASKHPRIQILTIEELLSSKRIDYPTTGAGNVTFKKAPKAKSGNPDSPKNDEFDWGEE